MQIVRDGILIFEENGHRVFYEGHTAGGEFVCVDGSTWRIEFDSTVTEDELVVVSNLRGYHNYFKKEMPEDIVALVSGMMTFLCNNNPIRF